MGDIKYTKNIFAVKMHFMYLTEISRKAIIYVESTSKVFSNNDFTFSELVRRPMTMKLNGEKVRMLMMERCTNIKRLAREAQIGETTVHNALNNTHDSNYRTVGKIARALNVSPAEIIRH